MFSVERDGARGPAGDSVPAVPGGGPWCGRGLFLRRLPLPPAQGDLQEPMNRTLFLFLKKRLMDIQVGCYYKELIVGKNGTKHLRVII